MDGYTQHITSTVTHTAHTHTSNGFHFIDLCPAPRHKFISCVQFYKSMPFNRYLACECCLRSTRLRYLWSQTNETEMLREEEPQRSTMRHRERTSLPLLSPSACKILASSIFQNAKQTRSESLVIPLLSNSIVKCDMNYYMREKERHPHHSECI